MVTFNYPRLDPARLVRVQYSIHQRFLADNTAVKAAAIPTVCFMTRKLADHVDRVLYSATAATLRAPTDTSLADCANS